jgi:hypothetical protein
MSNDELGEFDSFAFQVVLFNYLKVCVCIMFLTLSLMAPFAPPPPCLAALGLIGPRKKE